MASRNGQDCATVTNVFAQGLCYAANNTFDLNVVPGYARLPLCVPGFLSYGLLEDTGCAVAGKGTQTAYASCMCSTSFGERVISINSTMEQYCGTRTPFPSGVVLSVAEAYCMSVAGGFVLTGQKHEATATASRVSIIRTISSPTPTSTSSPGKFSSSTALPTSITSVGNSSAPTAVAAASGTSHRTLSGGAIAGIVVGGLVLHGFLFWLLWFLRNRRNVAKAPRAEEAGVVDPDHKIEPDQKVEPDEKVQPDQKINHDQSVGPGEKVALTPKAVSDHESVSAAEPPPAYEMHRFFTKFQNAAGVERTENNRS